MFCVTGSVRMNRLYIFLSNMVRQWHVVVGSSVCLSVIPSHLYKVQYFKFWRGYSNQTWTVSYSKGCFYFTDITCSLGCGGVKMIGFCQNLTLLQRRNLYFNNRWSCPSDICCHWKGSFTDKKELFNLTISISGLSIANIQYTKETIYVIFLTNLHSYICTRRTTQKTSVNCTQLPNPSFQIPSH